MWRCPLSSGTVTGHAGPVVDLPPELYGRLSSGPGRSWTGRSRLMVGASFTLTYSMLSADRSWRRAIRRRRGVLAS